MKHKHYDLIMSWANGAKIERYENGIWVRISSPLWSQYTEYRIKPKPKTDVVLYSLADDFKNNYGYLTSAWLSFEELTPNIKLTYYGEKHDLKSVEKI